MEQKYSNDNQPLELQPIAIALARVVKRLQPNEKQDEDAKRDGKRTDAGEKNPKADREYIETRLRELAQWERRIRGRNN